MNRDPRVRLKWTLTWPDKPNDYCVWVPTLDLGPKCGIDADRHPTHSIMRIYNQGQVGIMANRWLWTTGIARNIATGWELELVDAVLAAEAAWFGWWEPREVPGHWLRVVR